MTLRFFFFFSPPRSENKIVYNSHFIDDFRAEYAYNETIRIDIEPVCTDIKVRYYAHRQSDGGFTGASIRKYDCQYRGRVGFKGVAGYEDD